MLQAILTEFRQNGAILPLDQLSQRLDVTPEVLEGMLLTLVRKGRIIEIDGSQAACQACPVHQRCNSCAGGGKLYMLIERLQQDKPVPYTGSSQSLHNFSTFTCYTEARKKNNHTQ